MDYTQQALWFKLRKVVRYTRMYGPSRTLAKVQGQYHMLAKHGGIPTSRISTNGRKHVGLIGCGNFAHSNIAYYLRRNRGQVIRGVMDLNPDRAVSLSRKYGADYATVDAAEVISDPRIDLVYIASNHASHAEYAIAAIKAGKAVHVEKPHVIDEDQLHRLGRAVANAEKPRIRVGFNRPLSPIGIKIAQAVQAQSGACMVNWFVAGHEIDPSHWYFRPEEGGRILGNLCHWSDFTLRLIPSQDRYPIRILPARAVRSDCDLSVSYVFGDGSIGVISFSAKGHTFEGVRESLNVHKGDALIAMTDFWNLTIDENDKKRRTKTLFRQHGHEAAIMQSYLMSSAGGGAAGMDFDYLRQTAQLFLATRTALESNQEVVLGSEGMVAEPSDG